ncbi:MAG: SRPBCC domain-containing protein [Cyclobacteriaceae bacterium]|nr:SRPBCC domain-containing protein [Cyclobacteriaceae bacterium]
MSATSNSKISTYAEISAPINQVWTTYTSPRHVVKWNFASPDWHCPKAENELKPGSKFSYRMEARDGSVGFDFEGVFQEVKPNEGLSYVMEDGRQVEVILEELDSKTGITVKFDPEKTNSEELQKGGWQAILDNFKSYVESMQENFLHFEITIQAPPPKVFHTMISDEPYRKWTYVFSPGSYFQGTWEKDSKILFLGPDKEGNEGGMVSRIAENIPYQYISIEHLGFYSQGKEVTSGPEVEGFAGATENYSFYDLGEKTLLKVDLEVSKEYQEYFDNTWPKALQILKELCE